MKSRALRIREKQKARKPWFRRADFWVARVGDESWRKPRGLDNKIRIEKKGALPRVKIGYRKIRAARGLHPSGLIEVLVYRKEDLIGLRPGVHAVRIARTVGRRKRIEILEEAERRGLKVLNPGGAVS